MRCGGPWGWAPPLIPMLIEGQDFIDAQDELSVQEFMVWTHRPIDTPPRMVTFTKRARAKMPFAGFMAGSVARDKPSIVCVLFACMSD